MTTAEEEHFLRSSLLLLKGSLFITKKILLREEQREIEQTGRDIDGLLKTYKQKLEQQFKTYKQREILFPQNGRTKVEKWDISLLTGVLLTVFHSSLSDDERIAVKHIKYQRNEIYAHTAVASLSVNDYNDICSELKAAFGTLASGFDSDVKEQCNNNVETCLKGPLDLKTSLEQLKKMSETDDMFREILKRIDASGEETTLALTNTVRQESSALKGGISMEISRSENNICSTIRDLQLKKEDLIDIITNAIEQALEKRVERKVKVVDSELEVSGNETDQPSVDEAEDIVVRVTNEAIRRAKTSEENIEIREKIQEILDNIESQADLKALTAEKGCVVIRFDCSTYEQLFNLIIYMESEDMKQRLNKLADSLSRRLNTKDELYVSFSLSFKTLQSIVQELEANCRREYKRSVRIPIQVESVQGLIRLLECFKGGGLTNNLNKLSEALTKKVGANINVNSSININQFKEALEEFDHVTETTMQIDKTEDRSSNKRVTDHGEDKNVKIEEVEEKTSRRIASAEYDKKEDDGESLVHETAEKDTFTVEDIYSQTSKTSSRSDRPPLPRRDAYKEAGELSIPPITAYYDISSDIKPSPPQLREDTDREDEDLSMPPITAHGDISRDIYQLPPRSRKDTDREDEELSIPYIIAHDDISRDIYQLPSRSHKGTDREDEDLSMPPITAHGDISRDIYQSNPQKYKDTDRKYEERSIRSKPPPTPYEEFLRSLERSNPQSYKDTDRKYEERSIRSKPPPTPYEILLKLLERSNPQDTAGKYEERNIRSKPPLTPHETYLTSLERSRLLDDSDQPLIRIDIPESDHGLVKRNKETQTIAEKQSPREESEGCIML